MAPVLGRRNILNGRRICYDRVYHQYLPCRHRNRVTLSTGQRSIGRGYREDTSFRNDNELEVRLLKIYERIYNIPEVLLFYRIHDNQLRKTRQVC